MAPLQGSTLGQRQKYYNKLVQEAMSKKWTEIPKINYEDDDIDNMIKIDIACNDRNVEYILDVFKCEDMLYVSRAINKSTWLITDPQYAHIINPKYLHRELFPQMNAKAVTKLMLLIRRYLEDEIRCKAFYKYVNEKCPKSSLRWLLNCSVAFIETVVKDRASDIPEKIIIRLCKKSIRILRVFIRNTNGCCNIADIYQQLRYYLKNNATAEEFLDIVNSYHFYLLRRLNVKYTYILMKTCPHIIKDNFQTYYDRINLATFVKYMNTNEIKPFLINQCIQNFDTLAPFLDRLPREDIADLLETLYEIHPDVTENQSTDNRKTDFQALFFAIEGEAPASFRSIHRWYKFVPFNLAFQDIKKFIFAESSAEERHELLILLLTSASCNLDHVKTVLQYYHDKHINEPYVHKITFINSLLSRYDAFRFDDNTWSILNNLFQSLEVYIDSTNEVQECINTIILHNVLHGEQVPDIVEEKFESKSLIGFKNKLNQKEQDKLFAYLYNVLVKNICKQNVNSESGMHAAIELLKKLWHLIKNWDKVKTYHHFLVDKVGELGHINKTSPWAVEIENHRKRRYKKPNRDWKIKWRKVKKAQHKPYIDLPSIYLMMAGIKQELFEYSLELYPSEDVCINALKHDPGLLKRYGNDVDMLRCNDEVSLKRFLNKLRTYWPDSLAAQWTETNVQYLQKGKGHRALVRAILFVLPHNKVLDFIELHRPKKDKIHWNNTNEIELSIQKHIAKNMHIVRPQLPPDVVLWYAQGDYVQYTLLSLHSMFHNLRSNDIPSFINILLNSHTSLRKHGIRLAFAKFKTQELIKQIPVIWNQTTNSYIRAVVFKSTFDLLCNEMKPTTIKGVWGILSSFIDTLTDRENRIIYNILGRKACKVPVSIRGECYQKAYLFLESLPPSADLDNNSNRIFGYVLDVIEYLDSTFIENTLFYSIYDLISDKDYTYLKILSVYLLCSKDSDTQVRKYNKVLRPVIRRSIPKWINNEKENIKSGLEELLTHICDGIPYYVFEKKMTMPVQMIENICNALFKGLVPNVSEHYIILTRWELTAAYVEELGRMIAESKQPYTWEQIRSKSTKRLAEICVEILTDDVNDWFPSIYLLFKKALQSVFENFEIRRIDTLEVLGNMLDCAVENTEPIYLLVLNMLPVGWTSEFENKKKILKQKLYSHQSEEVAMHYFKVLSDKFNDNNNENDFSDEDISDDTIYLLENLPKKAIKPNDDRIANENTRNSWYGKMCNII